MECTKKRIQDHREKNLEKIQAYDRERGRTPKRRKRSREFSIRYRKDGRGAAVNRRWASRNPEKVLASRAVNNAVRDCRLVKLPCRDCGRTVGVEAHHPDYSKPLEVIWLCKLHHENEHHL